MNTRSGPVLIVVACCPLLAPLTTTAQPPSRNSLKSIKVMPPRGVGSHRSHHDLPGELDLNNAQEMMAQRLQELHELHQLQDQVQDLLKDPAFLDAVRQRFDDRQLQELRDRMRRGEPLGRDSAWNDLLRQPALQNKLDRRQLDLLKRWAERGSAPKEGTSEPPALMTGRAPPPPPPPSGGPSPTPMPPPSEAGKPPEPSWQERWQADVAKWAADHMDDLGGDVVEALAEMAGGDDNTPLTELLRAMREPDLSRSDLAGKAAGLADYLPRVGEFLHDQRGAWDDVREVFREASAPSLPGVGARPVRSTSAGGGPAVTALLLAALAVLVLWKTGALSRSRAGGTSGDGWRLGDWPVAPSAVASRRDLVRAFEHLALLRLGPDAGTHHHRDLAARLAELDADDPARRSAAGQLADLYEQARYAPAGEDLSPDQLSDARHALCSLAGVPAP